MLKIKNDVKSKQLYNEIKQIFFDKEKNSSYKYDSSSYLNNRDVEKELKDKYIRENGEVSFENINGNLITIKIAHWHQYKRWSRYGIYEVPSYKVEIYLDNELIWNLFSYCNDSFNGEYSETELSSLDIPYEIIKENVLKEDDSKENDIIEEPIITKSTKPKESRIIFNEITNLYNKYNSAEQTAQNIESKMQKKIDIEKKKIIQSFSEKKKKNKEEICSIKKELNEFNKLLVLYSTFDINMIGSAFQQLLSIIEYRDFSYEKVCHSFKKRVHGTNDSWDEDVENNVNIVINKDKYKSNYTSSSEYNTELDILVQNGDAVILSEQINNKNKITFYSIENNQIINHINFGRFNYLKDFINEIIQYRFQNSIINFEKKDILEFMQNFLIKKKEQIAKNIDLKIKQKTLSLKI